MIPRRTLTTARRALLRWYRCCRRDLPWRRTRDPYAIWVSEVMLQQTTVGAVQRYFKRFLERFPTITALAGASEDEVLALWSGLGYYHRARNLLRGARNLAAHHGSRFPKDRAAALRIPGVGAYTAHAVLSIAFGQPLAVVDGNVRRVLARFFAVRGEAAAKPGWGDTLAKSLLDRASPGDWNQAVMELGATVCTPRRPACPACPWKATCRARALGLENALPTARPRREALEVTIAAALVRRGDAFLFVRRPQGRLMGGMWELPQTTFASTGRADLVREARERYGLALRLGPLCAIGRHAITFRRIRLEGYRATLAGSASAARTDSLRWVRADEMAEIGTSSISRKLLAAALEPRSRRTAV